MRRTPSRTASPTVAGVDGDPDAVDRELEIQLQTELALAKAEREAKAVRDRALRWARIRFILIVLVLVGIVAGFTYLSLQALRDAFGA